MKYAVVIALLTGCSAVFGLDEVLLPGDAAPDSPPDAPSDTDGDGRLDSEDNCPAVANADQADTDKDDAGDVCDACAAVFDDQHDEDGDGVGDLCDNCPGVVNADQLNSDTDQLGDACDSWPAQIDCIARFDGFGSLVGWNVVRGTWTVENDQLVQTDPETQQGYLATAGTFTNPRVLIEGQLVAFGSANSRNVGVWGGATPAFAGGTQLPDGILSELYDPTADVAKLAVTRVSGNATAVAALEPYTALVPNVQVPAGARFLVALDLRTAPTWAAFASSSGSQRMLNGTNAPATNTGRAGVRSHGAIIRYDYISITTWTTGTCPPRT